MCQHKKQLLFKQTLNTLVVIIYSSKSWGIYIPYG